MSTSTIEWTGRNWNIVEGCSAAVGWDEDGSPIESPACRICYARGFAARRKLGLTVLGSLDWSGKVVVHPQMLSQPLRWRGRQLVFPVSTSDLFHPKVPLTFLAAILAVIGSTPEHVYQLLTKRPERARELFGVVDELARTGRRFDGTKDLVRDDGLRRQLGKRAWPRVDHVLAEAAREYDLDVGWCPDGMIVAGRRPRALRIPFENLWFGFTAENQANYDGRLAHARLVPAALHWVSVEPLSSFIDLRLATSPVSWVVAGGASGPGAWPTHPAWFLDLAQQCARHDRRFFLKQLGRFTPEPPPDSDPRRWRVLGLDGREYEDLHVAPAGAVRLAEFHSKKVAGNQLHGRRWQDMPPLPEVA